MLLTVLLVAVVLLAPGQPRQAIGIEIAAISEILAFQAILIARPAYEHMRDRLSWVLWAMLLLLLPALALMIGGISFAIEDATVFSRRHESRARVERPHETCARRRRARALRGRVRRDAQRVARARGLVVRRARRRAC